MLKIAIYEENGAQKPPTQYSNNHEFGPHKCSCKFYAFSLFSVVRSQLNQWANKYRSQFSNDAAEL